MGAKRLGGKRLGGKRLGGETTRGRNGLGAKRPGFVDYLLLLSRHVLSAMPGLIIEQISVQEAGEISHMFPKPIADAGFCLHRLLVLCMCFICTVQPHYNAPHYSAVFNITLSCHGSRIDYFVIYLL